MTPGFVHIFIAPQSFLFDKTFGELANLDIVHFSDEFFCNIQGYNSLMLNIEFYKHFQDFDYMLIHQSDAYLFKDELQHWCDQNYDYIGAPWFNKKFPKSFKWKKFKLKYLHFIYSQKQKENKFHHFIDNQVGNGGLSLRKIATFITVLEATPHQLLNKYKAGDQIRFNEDVFWALEAEKIKKTFKKPSCLQALHFSFEQEPALAFETINTLPFGCHAFNIHGTEFWKQHIPFIKSIPNNDARKFVKTTVSETL